MNKTKSNGLALTVLTALFFMWGFITCLNDILVPYLKKIFDLSYTEATLVQFSFFGAYFVGSLAYLILSFWRDPISIIGYKKGIIIGLIVSAIACMMFYPAAANHQFSLFLLALFVLGIGFTLLQIAANPYVAIIGPERTASSRLNLSQGFNSLGTTIAPIIGGYLIFHYFNKFGAPNLNNSGIPILTDTGLPLTANSVQIPYFIFAAIFVLLAFVVYFTPLPDVSNQSEPTTGFGALRHRNLVLGFIAIFMYVGAEVAIGSMMISYLKESMSLPEMSAKSYLAFYWGGLMIGRFAGSIALSDKFSTTRKTVLMVAIAFAAFGFIYFASGLSINEVWPFLLIVILNLLAFYFSKSSPNKTLLIFASIAMTLIGLAMLTTGAISMWLIIGVGLFNSIMWSNIFTLAIAGLGKFAGQASSILIMAIVGGALIPPLQGFFADSFSVHFSFIIPLVCYIYLIFYGLSGFKTSNDFKKII